MVRCQLSAGFLVPRQCGNVATDVCSTCGRSICTVHTVAGEAGIQCSVCATGSGRYFDRNTMFDDNRDAGSGALLDDTDEDIFQEPRDEEEDGDLS